MKSLKKLRVSSLCVLLAVSLAAPASYAGPPASPAQKVSSEKAEVAAHAETQPEPDEKAKARIRFERGVELYDSGDVEAAYIEFRRAYSLVPSYHLLFNIAQTQAELKDYVGAMASLRRYLQDGGSEISAERRVAVHNEIRRLKTYVAYIRLNVSAKGAQIKVDGVISQEAHRGQGIAVSAGRRKIEVSHKGYLSWERDIDVAGEDRLSLDVMLVPKPSEAPQRLVVDAPLNPVVRVPAEPPPKRLGAMFWTGVGATAVFGAGAAALGILALKARDEHKKLLGTAPTTQEKLNDSAQKVKNLALGTDIGLILTTSAAAFTIAAVFLGRKKRREYERKRLNAAVSPNGVWLRGRF